MSLPCERYNENDLPDYTPMKWCVITLMGPNEIDDFISPHRTLNEIRAAIPAKYFLRDMRKGLYYLFRDLLLAAAAWSLALRIDPLLQDTTTAGVLSPLLSEVVRWVIWCI
jgi:omega-6 fatty acid desaturase (delta-12 desaturase)